MQYQATEKYIRSSTRKVRLVADAIRSLSPQKALAALSLTPKEAAKPLSKAIASALSNARQKGATDESVVFETIDISGGPAMKRWRPVSRGSAHTYKKRMTHIRIVLTDKEDKK